MYIIGILFSAAITQIIDMQVSVHSNEYGSKFAFHLVPSFSTYPGRPFYFYFRFSFVGTILHALFKW